MKRQIILIATIVVAHAWTGLAFGWADADDAKLQAAFEKQFGADLEKVGDTTAKLDDVQLATKILAAIGEQKPSKEMAVYMCGQAYDLAMRHPSGYAYAVLAMQYVGKLDTELNVGARRNLINAYASLYEHGRRNKVPNAPDASTVLAQYTQLADDLMFRRDAAQALQILKEAAAFASRAGARDQRLVLGKRMAEINVIVARNKRIEELQAALAKQPGDQEARTELLDIYLVQMDDPAQAADIAGGVNDKTLQANVKLAAGDPKSLNAASSLQLAKWYELKGRDLRNANRVAMFIRAKLYYQHFQSRYREEDGKLEQVADALKVVDKSLRDLGIGKKLARRKVIKLRGEEPRAGANPEIDRAIAKGVAWLYEQQDKAANWELDPADKARSHPGGHTALAAYALLMAEENPVTNEKLNRAVRATFARQMDNTYAVCFRAHMWEVLPDSEVFDKAMRDDADRLSRVITSKGEYHYKVQKGTTGDLSTTLAGFLALWLAETSGVVDVGHEPWRMICQRLITIQRADGGWAYKNSNDRKTSGSMTAAGLTILLMALDQDHLTDGQAKLVRESIDRGMQWMDRHFSATSNPGGGWKNYYLVAVQHVGVLSGRRKFKEMDWYETAAKHLVATQGEDGSWGGNLSETAFAVIFLARGGIYYSERSGLDDDDAATGAAKSPASD